MLKKNNVNFADWPSMAECLFTLSANVYIFWLLQQKSVPAQSLP
jgi:hypothetical protein